MSSSSRRSRFVLVDPCLTGPGSHPYHYAMLVLAAVERAGWECLLVTHRDFDSATAGWRVLPAFTHTAYSKYTLGGGLDRLDDGGRPSWLPPLPWATRHADRRRAERIDAFATEVQPALAGLAAGDVVLVATASELESIGLARAVAATRPPLGVGWHVQFHLPILRGFAADFPRQESRLGAARTALREAWAAAAPHAIAHHATTAELAAQYARLMPGAVGVLPYPVHVPPPRPRPEAGPLRVACLGDARPEKHAECLAAVVKAAAADPVLAGRLHFAVQTNRGYPAASRRPEHVAVTRSLTVLAGIAAAGGPVDLLGGPLGAEDYARELAAADIVLLPYDQGRYRTRCSGIVLEALAAGAVPIVTGGGWMARQFAATATVHAAALVAGGRVLATRRLERPRLGRSPLVIDLPPTADAAVVVQIEWDGSTDERIDLPPVRVAVSGVPTRPATVLAAGDAVAGSAAVFPLATAGRPRVECSAAGNARSAAPATITIHTVAAAGAVPASAVGLVIDAPASVPAALAEVVRHAAHYRRTAADHAVAIRHSATGDEVVRRLCP